MLEKKDGGFLIASCTMVTGESTKETYYSCKVCGEEATQTYRKTDEGEQVLVDDGDNYEARCKEHWEPR